MSVRAGRRSRGPAGIGRYVAARLAQGVLVVLGAVTITFVLFNLVGDPIAAQPNVAFMTPAQKQALRVRLGYDAPALQRYGDYVGSVAHGDFGTIAATGEPALGAVLVAAPHTLLLMSSALTLALCAALPLAIWSALHRDTRREQLLRAGMGVVQAIPEFWLALVLVLVVSVWLRLLPSFGYRSPASLILPMVTLATPVVPALFRLVRNQLLDVLQRDFVLSLRGRGFSPRSIVVRHGLLNIVAPTSAFFALQIGWLLGGSVIIEPIFAWPGIGNLMVSAVGIHEYSVLGAIVILVACGYVVVNLLADVVALTVDPRVAVEVAQ